MQNLVRLLLHLMLVFVLLFLQFLLHFLQLLLLLVVLCYLLLSYQVMQNHPLYCLNLYLVLLSFALQVIWQSLFLHLRFLLPFLTFLLLLLLKPFFFIYVLYFAMTILIHGFRLSVLCSFL